MNAIPLKDGEYDLPFINLIGTHVCHVFPADDPRFRVDNLRCRIPNGSFDSYLKELEELQKAVFRKHSNAQDLQFVAIGLYSEREVYLAFLVPLTAVQRTQAIEQLALNARRETAKQEVLDILKLYPELKTELRSML